MLKFSRINLQQTNYSILDNWEYLTNPSIPELNLIYKKYCTHKKFESVMPLFANHYLDINTEIIGYYDKQKLVAFSLIKRLDQTNVEAVQFAWDYENPKLRLGISSLQNECAIYKQRGFEYLYLGYNDKYKKSIQGFEILGPA